MSVEFNVEKEPELVVIKLPENSADSGFETSETSTNKGDPDYFIVPFEPLNIIDDDSSKVEVVLQSSAVGEPKGRICNHSSIHGPENKDNDISVGKKCNSLNRY